MLHLDGSRGEGGGQILRTALALSLVTGRAFRIKKIRSGRRKPGLRRQHLTAVRAAASIGRAQVRGAEPDSREITFRPREVVPGDYRFDIGTAGSATLVLQTVLPPLLTAPGPSTLVLEGGTHNPQAPPFDFLARTFLPLIGRMGPEVDARLERHGFFPAGGGRFTVTVRPARILSGFDLLERGQVRARRAKALLSRLPRHIADRELKVIARELGLAPSDLEVVEVRDPAGPGNAVIIELESEQVTEIVTGFGQRGVRAETVAGDAARQAQRYFEADVPVGEHLADQLLLPLALAGRGSFRTLPLTPHARTNLEVLQAFLPLEVREEEESARTRLVRLHLPNPAGEIETKIASARPEIEIPDQNREG